MGSGLAQAMAKTPEGRRFVLSDKEDDEGGEGTDCGSYAHRLPALGQRAVDLSFTARFSSVAIPPLEVSVGERGAEVPVFVSRSGASRWATRRVL